MKHELVPLGSFMSPALDEVRVDPETTYRTAGIYSFGRGLFARSPVVGAETKYRTFLRLRRNQFVFSRLNGWEGALAVVPPEFDGFLVSAEYPTFDIYADRADPQFVAWMCRWPALWERLTPKGSMVRRKRSQPAQAMGVEVPLPPLPLQRTIASWLGSLEMRRALAQDLAERVATMAAIGSLATLTQAFSALEQAHDPVPLSDIAEINPESVNPSVDLKGQSFLYVDLGSVEKGTGRIGATARVSGDTAPSRARRRIRAGDVLVSTVRPNLRGFAVVPEELDGQVCSTGFAVLRPRDETSPRYLLYQVLSSGFLDQLTTRGGHYPAVNDSVLRAARVVLPPRRKQDELVARLDWMLARFETIGSLAEAQDDQLRALLPATLDRVLANRAA